MATKLLTAVDATALSSKVLATAGGHHCTVLQRSVAQDTLRLFGGSTARSMPGRVARKGCLLEESGFLLEVSEQGTFKLRVRFKHKGPSVAAPKVTPTCHSSNGGKSPLQLCLKKARVARTFR